MPKVVGKENMGGRDMIRMGETLRMVGLLVAIGAGCFAQTMRDHETVARIGAVELSQAPMIQTESLPAL